MFVRISLSMWMCVAHNEVNQKIGKPQFNCDKVWKKWGGKEYIEEEEEEDRQEKDENCGKFCADTLGAESVKLLEDTMREIKNKKYKL
jgi:hypothetical protein